jgi:hypothetical protein
VTVSATDVASQTITVTQDAALATLLVSQHTVSIANEASSRASITIASNTAWTVSSDQLWLSVNPASGSGDGTVVFSAEANPTSSVRTAIVTVLPAGAEPQAITITQHGTVDISRLKPEDLKLYSNPVTDGFRIGGFEGKAMVTITDVSGKQILIKEISSNEYTSVANLSKGMYLLSIKTDDGEVTKKMIKE